MMKQQIAQEGFHQFKYHTRNLPMKPDAWINITSLFRHGSKSERRGKCMKFLFLITFERFT